MLPFVGGSLPSGQESLLMAISFLLLVVGALWFWGSVLLRWAYALRQIPKEFDRGRTNSRDPTDEKSDE